MADEEVATKAPESDAQEQSTAEAEKISGIEGDTKPDQGAASMGVRPIPSYCVHLHTYGGRRRARPPWSQTCALCRASCEAGTRGVRVLTMPSRRRMTRLPGYGRPAATRALLHASCGPWL